MSEQKDDCSVKIVTKTTIDLTIIQQQLDDVESALLTAWWLMKRTAHTEGQEQQITDAIDKLLAVKKSFGLKSDLIPVKEQQNASFTELI